MELVELCKAIEENDVAGVQKLLQTDNKTIYLNQSETKQCPLHLACKLGSLDIVRLLMGDERVDVNKQNEKGETPFFVACLFERVEVVKLMMENEKVDVDCMDHSKITPFYDACQKGILELIKLLSQDKRVDACMGEFPCLSVLLISTLSLFIKHLTICREFVWQE